MVWLKALEQRVAVLLPSVPVFPKALSDFRNALCRIGGHALSKQTAPNRKVAFH